MADGQASRITQYSKRLQRSIIVRPVFRSTVSIRCTSNSLQRLDKITEMVIRNRAAKINGEKACRCNMPYHRKCSISFNERVSPQPGQGTSKELSNGQAQIV